MGELGWMVAPTTACLLMVLALSWFGFHVLQRGVIFVDLALAQVAALGTTYAVFLGHQPDEGFAYALSLVFTAIGAVSFSAARRFEDRVPQESIIGIAYAVSAGLGILVIELADDPHGAEKLQHLMVGNVVWVSWPEIAAIAGVVGVVGIAHALARHPLLQVSMDPEGARAAGRAVWAWDLFFYLSFGLVITTLVHVAGVLLIFSFLVIPAVIARLLTLSAGRRLAIAYAVGVTAAVAGISMSYEHAAGPVIVSLLGGLLLLTLIGVAVRSSPTPAATAGRVAAGIAAVAAVLWGFSRFEVEHGDHHGHEEHHDHAHMEEAHAATPPEDPAAREAQYRGWLDQPDRLEEALTGETDASLRLLLGAALARSGRRSGLEALAELAAGEVPFLRMEAHDRLALAAGEEAPDYDPLSGPDSERVWAAWAAAPGDGWQARAADIPLP